MVWCLLEDPSRKKCLAKSHVFACILQYKTFLLLFPLQKRVNLGLYFILHINRILGTRWIIYIHCICIINNYRINDAKLYVDITLPLFRYCFQFIGLEIPNSVGANHPQTMLVRWNDWFVRRSRQVWRNIFWFQLGRYLINIDTTQGTFI